MNGIMGYAGRQQNPLAPRPPAGGAPATIAGGLDQYIRQALQPPPPGQRGVPPVPLYDANTPITIGGIYSPQMMDQRVNQMRAQNDATNAGQMRQMAERTASAGYGTNSPLQMALQQQMQGRTMAANAQGENDFRFNAAGENAKHLLATETASAQFTKNDLQNWLQFYLANQELELQKRQMALANDPRHQAALAGSTRVASGMGTGPGMVLQQRTPVVGAANGGPMSHLWETMTGQK